MNMNERLENKDGVKGVQHEDFGDHHPSTYSRP
ncbi:hypothetical protein Leryth_027141, partial [Lithospermum erythrorhizon]